MWEFERLDLPDIGARGAELRTGDVGGYQLDWMCRGVGSPAVVAEAGYDSSGTDTWVDLLGPVSEISRICTYDRAGTGTSDSRPDDLHVTSMLQAPKSSTGSLRVPASNRRTWSSATPTAGS